jgi:hypothetical protein
MTACGMGSLIGVDGSEVGIYPLRCKQWACDECGPKKVRATIAMIRSGMRSGTPRFFTLTSPGEDDAVTSYDKFQERWHRFQARLRRRYGTVEYVAVVERQKRGAAHVHVVYRGEFIPWQWLGRAAAASGFGKIVDIRKPAKRIERYLAKYLTKELDDPKFAPPRYFRRVRRSRRWSDWRPPRREPRWPAWLVARATPSRAAQAARGRGYIVVELVLGRDGRTQSAGP